jgi:hypothetical protein
VESNLHTGGDLRHCMGPADYHRTGGALVNHLETGCIVPAMQSLFVGILSGSVATGLAFWMDLSEPWALGVVCGCCAALWLFIGGIQLWRLDVFSVPYIAPEPVEATSSVVRVEVVSEDHKWQFAELNATSGQIKELASGLLAGAAFSESAWCGSNRPFSKSEFQAIRQEFIKRGWARWRVANVPSQGLTVTAPGFAVCRSLAQNER